MKNIKQYLSGAACLGAALLITLTTGCAGDRYSRSTGEAIDDTSITAKVKSEFIGDSEVSAMQVKVDTYRGQVQLTGFVDTESQKQRAEQIARNVNGVESVKNDLIVKTDEAAGAKTPEKKEYK